MSMIRLIAASVVTLAALVGPPSAVAAYGGTVAWSAYDDATGRYELMVSDSRGVRALGVPARGAAFDADLGPGPTGKPVLVYSRCARDPSFAKPLGFRGCRLYRFDLPSGPERAIPVHRPTGFSDTHPAIWRGRLAWVRRADSGAGADRPEVLVANADGSGSARALALITLRRCWENYDPSPPTVCGPTSLRAVVGLDLSPAGVAVGQEYLCPAANGFSPAGCGGGFSQREVVYAPLSGRVRRIADTIAGLGGQSWIGPAFAGNGLYFGRACLGDPGGCDRGGSRIVRYDLRTHRFTRTPGPVRLYGFGVDGVRFFELLEPQPDRGCSLFYVPSAERPAGQGPCTLVNPTGLRFTQFRDGRTA